MPNIEYYGTGRRKTSTARVFLRPGSGTITVNHREFDNFFPTDALRLQVRRPLLVTETGEKFDVLATVAGGGVNGQAGAVRLGIARALVAKPQIYLFDDSFSALDLATDARLRAALRPHTREATVVIVAQRVSTITDADQILVLEDGRLVGVDTHEELLATNATYAEIVESQLAAEEAA